MEIKSILSFSFNMISSEPSIETLPDFSKHGLLTERNVINDQTIANYCSDTVRELNNLTEELHHTDLHMGRFNNNRSMGNGIGATNKPPFEQDNESSELRQPRQEIVNNHNPINNLSQMNSNREYESNCNGRIGYIDAVDSSPFYTQLSQHLENNLSNLSDDGNRRSKSCDRSLTPVDSVDGHMDNGSIDDSDEFRISSCMLQSVDLRGNQLFLPIATYLPIHIICSVFAVADTSPMASLASDAQSLWHGNIETSTDTLVPVMESTQCGDGLSVDTTSKLYMNASLIEDASTNGVDLQRNNDIRSRVLSPSGMLTVARPSKGVWSNGGPTYMDESILMQPEHQRMDIANGGRSETVTTINGPGMHVPMHRRRRNSSNSKQTTVDVISPNGQIPNRLLADNLSPTGTLMAGTNATSNTSNTRFILPNARTVPITPPGMRSFNAPTLSTQPSSTAVNISCPDGLAHALSEQNLRLQQIVHDHKVHLNYHEVYESKI